jgi:hypothetical protein
VIALNDGQRLFRAQRSSRAECRLDDIGHRARSFKPRQMSQLGAIKTSCGLRRIRVGLVLGSGQHMSRISLFFKEMSGAPWGKIPQSLMSERLPVSEMTRNGHSTDLALLVGRSSQQPEQRGRRKGTGSEERRRESFFLVEFRGRPGGRWVCSRASAGTVRLVHFSPPNGALLTRARRTEAASDSVIGWLSCSVHWCDIGSGHADSW